MSASWARGLQSRPIARLRAARQDQVRVLRRKETPQPLYNRACLFQSAINQDQALTISNPHCQGYGVACASAGAKDHHSQIAQID